MRGCVRLKGGTHDVGFPDSAEVVHEEHAVVSYEGAAALVEEADELCGCQHQVWYVMHLLGC